jgi:glutathione synthase/RimK-type ligase-like ATP-grasp enzyme
VARRAPRAPFVNAPSALALAHDKAEALAALAAAGLRTVPTALVRARRGRGRRRRGRSPASASCSRPCSGAAGRGVVGGPRGDGGGARARRPSRRLGPGAGAAALGGGVDRRLFVVGGRIVACMERRPESTGRANLRVGASAPPFEPDARETALAVQAAAALHLDVAGVDLLHDEAGRCSWRSTPRRASRASRP